MSSAESENVKTLASINAVENLSTEPKITRDAIDKMVTENLVNMTDNDEAANLQLFCYVKCGPESEYGKLLPQCRGVVFNDKNIVMQAFPYTIEYSDTDKDDIVLKMSPLLQECKIFDSYEGTLIRMFHFSGKWYTCTHRKLNAFRSKWASKESFGTAFKRALESEVSFNNVLRSSIPDTGECLLERFQTILDPLKQYMFLVLHNEENRIVCDPPSRPSLLHVGTFVGGELIMNENINIPTPKELTFDNIDSMIEYVKNINIREKQGVIIFAPNNKQYKILNKDYLKFFSVRGNEPSIKYRYLQVRMNSHLIDIFLDLYPNMIEKFEEYEDVIYAIAQNIYKSYVERYIKKQWVTVPIEEYKVVTKCHAFHEQDRKKNRVSIGKVIEVLNEQPPTVLNKMIRRFKNEKNHPSDTTQVEKNRRQQESIVPTPNE